MVILRAFVSEDLEALAALFTRSVHKVCDKEYSQQELEAWAPVNYDLEAWRSSFQDKHVLLAEEAGHTVGFGELTDKGWIDRVYVDPNWIGKGIGTALVSALERYALSLGMHKLYVDASLTAQPFFAARGYLFSCKKTKWRRGVELVSLEMYKELGDV